MQINLKIQNLAIGTFFVALVVLGMKILAWRLTGSVALYSDALESVVNVGAAALAWFAIRLANRPADANHPFGHHKAEYISAVAEGVLIVLAALLILRAAFAAFTSGPALEITAAGITISILAALINAAWAVILIRAGRARRSPALDAGGRHLMTDVWTTVGVLVGLMLAQITGFALIDPLLALIVAVNILWEGWHVISGSVYGLMDGAAADEDQESIAKIIRDTAGGALQAHDIKTRRSGRALFIEFHLVVDSEMTVAVSHDICDRIEQSLVGEFPGAHTTIHVEPTEKLRKNGLKPRSAG